MSITNGYCTLAELKAFLTPTTQTLPTDSADDAVLESLVESASRFIDGETCRRFYVDSADVTKYFTADDASCLSVGDLVSVTTIYTDGGLRTYPDTWTTDDFDLWPYNASAMGRPYTEIRVSPISDYFFTPGLAKGVKIVGKFGWPAVPVAIKEACILIAASLDKRRFGQNLSETTTITAGGVVVTPQDVPSMAWAKINPFRRRT